MFPQFARGILPTSIEIFVHELQLVRLCCKILKKLHTNIFATFRDAAI